MPNAIGVHWQSVHKLMTKLGYKKSDSYATMFYNEATDVTVFIYVDDGFLVGESRALFQVIKAIEERFKCSEHESEPSPTRTTPNRSRTTPKPRVNMKIGTTK